MRRFVSGCLAFLLIGCAGAERFKASTTGELCLNQSRLPSYNIWHEARAAELARRGENCSTFGKDAYECEQESAKIYPPNLSTQVSGGYQAPSTTNCYTTGSRQQYTNCTTTPGMSVPPSTKQADLNVANRERAFKTCLKARGW